MTAVERRPSQASSVDIITRTAQQLTNYIANRRSDKPKSAGLLSVSYAPGYYMMQNDIAMYTLGQNYAGAACRPVEQFGSKGPKSAVVCRHKRLKQEKHKLLKPSSMNGVKVCFACERDHLAVERHSSGEITTSIEQLKLEHPTTLLTVEALSTIFSMMEVDDDMEAEETDDWVHWAKN